MKAGNPDFDPAVNGGLRTHSDLGSLDPFMASGSSTKKQPLGGSTRGRFGTREARWGSASLNIHRLNLYGSIPRSLLRTISLLIPRSLLRGRSFNRRSAISSESVILNNALRMKSNPILKILLAKRRCFLTLIGLTFSCCHSPVRCAQQNAMASTANRRLIRWQWVI